jgi:5-methylcytosine-specific restriction endonuclease McrA
MSYNEKHLVEVFNRTGGCCFYCSRDLAFHAYRLYSERGAWVVDRFIPVSKGGVDGPENWAACCLACSHQKAEQMPWEFDPERFQADVWQMECYLSKMDNNGASEASCSTKDKR